eukprot:g17737.t1
MVGRKEALRTLPVFLALNVACTNGATAIIATDRAALPRAEAPGKRDAGATLPERLDIGNPRRKLLETNGAVSNRNLLRVRGGVSRAGAKDKKTGLRLPASPIDRALAVNGVSWAAVVGGVLWSRTKMGPEGGGIVRKALLGAVVSSTTVQVASNVLQAVSGSGDGPRGQGYGANAIAGLRSFRWAYLGVFAACNLGEFLQGAYIYQLYSENNGLDIGTISKMFLAGMFSAMLTGLFAGSLLDRYGRRNGCMLWAILNIVQCALIRSRVFGALVLGRVIAGASSTLLVTAFESWMVTAHHSRGFPSHFLADTFRMATWGTGLAAIASGFLGDVSVKGMGLLAPFNLAIGVSLVALLLIGRLWKENYGDRSFSAFHHTQEALESIASDGRLLMIILVQALFEGSMLAFIVVWVPALKQSTTETIALGTVFSTMMICLCGGSSLFKLMTEGLPVRLAFSPEACLVLATGLGSVALGASSMELRSGKLLLMLLVYETCIGLYFPAMATCRSKYIDDRVRGTIMNITRVPVNLVAALMMLGPVGNTSVSLDDRLVTVFGILAGLTGVATLIQVLLLQREKEAGVIIAYGGSGAMASLSKEMKGREVVANAKQQRSGQAGEGEGGGWSFFTLPAVKAGNAASSASTTPAAATAVAAAAATAASTEGALAGWMIMSAPSAKRDEGGIVTPPAPRPRPRPRVPATKLPTHVDVKDTRGTALLAFASAITSKERATSPPVVPASTARHRQTKAKVASLPRASLTNRRNKGSEDARSTLSLLAKPSTASSKRPKSSGQPSNWARRAESRQEQEQGQGQGQGQASLSDTGPAWTGAGRGKVAAFISSVAGGVAATGWFLLRMSNPGGGNGQPPHDKHERWSNPFGDLNANVPANTRHRSWLAPSSNSNDGNRDDQGDGGGRGSGGVEGENAQRGGAVRVDTEGVGNGDFEREAGVWVGWGGGCAF